MGKRPASRAKGKGSLTYRIRRRAYRYKIDYPVLDTTGKAKVERLINSPGHYCPLALIIIDKKSFYVPAAEGLYEGQEIEIGSSNIVKGNIVRLKEIPAGTKVFNIESSPGSGGKILRSSGCSGIVMNNENGKVEILIKRRKIVLNENSRAIIGSVAGDGRVLKPLIKAGKRHYMMKAKGRKWHRTSPIKVNALDHPFGSGRGKRAKPKIAKRNSPPGRKAGHIRPRRTGHVK